MNMNIEKHLYAIDQAFGQKSERDVMVIYAMIFMGFFAFSYLLFWEASEAEYKQAEQLSANLQMKINKDKQFLMQNPESKITQIDNKIKEIETATIAMHDNNDYIKYKIEQISELFYDEPAWGKYIDSISENAKRYKVNIALLTNRVADDKNKFGHVLDIQVKADGKYHQIVKFLNSMEQSDLVVDIHDMKFMAEKKLSIDVNLSVWGIKY